MLKRCAMILMLFLFDPLVTVADEDGKKRTDPAAAAKSTMKVVGQLTGEITEISKDGQKLVLEVEGVVPTWTRSSSPRSKTPPQLKNKKQKFEMEVKLADEVKVRLPADADDEEAKAAAKDPNNPDRKLPGKAGGPTDLKKGQIISVTFGQTRDKPPLVYGTLVLVLKDKLK